VSATAAKFRFVNYVTDYSVTVEVEGTFSSDRSTAEYIIERPAFSEGELVWVNPLADYHSSEWYAFTNGEELEKLPFNTAYMVDKKGTAMSSPGKLEGYYFPMSFENCGERDVLHE